MFASGVMLCTRCVAMGKCTRCVLGLGTCCWCDDMHNVSPAGMCRWCNDMHTECAKGYDAQGVCLHSVCAGGVYYAQGVCPEEKCTRCVIAPGMCRYVPQV